ncbi:hypothetical protein BON22_2003 [Cyberlindnera fabianii]|uniref:Uncharacterized protein n=1 Tax=Cyberlindnera fabianii TaxID=36022 RepID=A0A1V2L7Q6_CYBFA|nr:hypothetical protein BON22_2003 [Cyberlindnera fabianii]
MSSYNIKRALRPASRTAQGAQRHWSPPRATSPSTIKGVPAPIQQFYQATRPGFPITLATNNWFKCTFFPADHFLGLFRKSSPAMRMRYVYGTALFNDPKVPHKLKSRFSKSPDALDQSNIRVILRRIYRDAMWKTYAGADGVYVFDVGLVPTTKDELDQVHKLLADVMIKATNVDCTKMIKQANSKIQWNRVRTIMREENIPIPQGFEELEAASKGSSPKQKQQKMVASAVASIQKGKHTW